MLHSQYIWSVTCMIKLGNACCSWVQSIALKFCRIIKFVSNVNCRLGTIYVSQCDLHPEKANGYCHIHWLNHIFFVLPWALPRFFLFCGFWRIAMWSKCTPTHPWEFTTFDASFSSNMVSEICVYICYLFIWKLLSLAQAHSILNACYILSLFFTLITMLSAYT